MVGAVSVLLFLSSILVFLSVCPLFLISCSCSHFVSLSLSDIHTEAVQAALAKHKEEKMALPMPTKRRSAFVQSPAEDCTPPGHYHRVETMFYVGFQNSTNFPKMFQISWYGRFLEFQGNEQEIWESSNQEFWGNHVVLGKLQELFNPRHMFE